MQSYSEYQDALKSEQKGLTKDQLIAQLQAEKDEYDPTKPKFEQVLDIDNLPGQEHVWVDRGIVISCEGGTHGNHQVYKRR